jgi:hypothetical protein
MKTVPPAWAPSAQPSTAPGLWSRALAFDWARPGPGLLLAALYIASRLPWLALGYGADPDAWRVAMSARYLLQHGSYLPSRLPGYPVHDIAMAALIWGGWRLTNLATVIVSLAGVFCFALILRRHDLPVRGLLTLTFAFMPLLWITSAQTLDYSWALTFLLAAYLALIDGRLTLSGVLLGLAGGCRVTYLAFLLPLALLAWQQGRLRQPLQLIAAALATWLIVFSPVWLRYGTAFWNFYDVRPDWGDFFHALTEGSIGLLPLLVLIVCLCYSWREIRRLPRLLQTEPNAAAWAMIALLALFVFVRLPLQTYYLMPGVPFALLLLARIVRPPALVAICLALVLGGFVDIYTTSPAGWRSPAAIAHIRPTPGLVLLDYRLRADRLALVTQVRDLSLPQHSVLTAGFYFPMVAELFHNQLQLALPDGYLRQVGPLTDNARASDDRDIVYVWLLTQGDARRLISDGYQVYSLDFSREAGRPAAVRVYTPENERFGLH